MKPEKKTFLKSLFYGMALILMMSGCCMESLNRSHDHYLKSDNNLYTTTQFNWHMLSDIYSPQGRNEYPKLAAAFAIICGPVIFLEIPVSFTVDTIFFPYDIYDYYDKYYIRNFWKNAIRDKENHFSLIDYKNHTTPYINYYLSLAIHNKIIPPEFFDKLTDAILSFKHPQLTYRELIIEILKHELKIKTLEKMTLRLHDKYLKQMIYNHKNSNQNLRNMLLVSFFKKDAYPYSTYNKQTSILEHDSITSEKLLELVKEHKKNKAFVLDVLRSNKVTSEMINIIYHDWKKKLPDMEDKYLADCIIYNKHTSEAILLDLLDRNRMNNDTLYDISKSPNLSHKVLSRLVKILVNKEYFAYNMHEYTNMLTDLLEENKLSQKDKQMILELTKKSKIFSEQYQDSDYKNAFPYYREKLLDALKE